MAGIFTHFCNPLYGDYLGEGPRDNVLVDVSSQSTLYSGRAFFVNENGEAEEGHSYATAPLFIAKKGVDRSDVAGVDAVTDDMTGSVGAAIRGSHDLTGGWVTGGYGRIPGLPMRPGLRVQTTEYKDTAYTEGDQVKVADDSGQFEMSQTASDTVGVVAGTDTVHELDVLDIRFNKPNPDTIA